MNFYQLGGLSSQQVESNATPLIPTTPWRVTEELRRSAAPFASPFISRLHEPRRLQRTSKARLVQPTPEEQLIRLLELAQRERGWKQSKRNRRLVESNANRLERCIEKRALSWCQRGYIRERKPRTVFIRSERRALRHDADVPNRKIGLGGMAATITECTNLLEPRRLDVGSLGRDAARGIDHRLVIARLIVRRPPLLARARLVCTDEQHSELFTPRREENDIDRECRTPRSGSRGGCLGAFAHDARISHERILMSRPREFCHELTPTPSASSRAPIVDASRDTVNVLLRCSERDSCRGDRGIIAAHSMPGRFASLLVTRRGQTSQTEEG